MHLLNFYYYIKKQCDDNLYVELGLPLYPIFNEDPIIDILLLSIILYVYIYNE